MDDVKIRELTIEIIEMANERQYSQNTIHGSRPDVTWVVLRDLLNALTDKAGINLAPEPTGGAIGGGFNITPPQPAPEDTEVNDEAVDNDTIV